MDIGTFIVPGLLLTGVIVGGCCFACWSRAASLFDTLSLDEAFVRLQRRLGAPRDPGTADRIAADRIAADRIAADAPPSV